MIDRAGSCHWVELEVIGVLEEAAISAVLLHWRLGSVVTS